MKYDLGVLTVFVGQLEKLLGRYPHCAACDVLLSPRDYCVEFRWRKHNPLFLCYPCAEKVTRKLFNTMFVV